MEFRILGPLEVRAAGRAVAVPGAKPRAVLAMLLLNANQPVSGEQLAVALWGEEARSGAVNTVQVHVSRLRKALGNTEALLTTPAGYQLRLEPDELDAQRFERRLADARDELAASRPGPAAAALEEALSLWRGRPLDDLAYEPFAQREIARLEEERLAALELLVDARLALGRHAEVVGTLEALIAEHPYRERLRAQLMVALYRCDRQADALQAYQDARRALSEELGIAPGERLRELEQAVLTQDPALAAPAEAPPPPADEAPHAEGPPPGRRLVSVVIAGAPGLAERLDAESMHGVLDRYSAVIERHGGSVEGFVGDALVGVFGQIEVHEDDSLRAVRAAAELREAGGMRVGVESGEVFVGAGARGASFAAGGVFNLAARLQGTAPAGEILLGETVYGLVRHAVRAEPADHAWRLIDLEPTQAPTTPFVNRRSELDALRAAFARTRDEAACHAMTVVGPAGMGKSRLAAELAAELEGEATVVVGRCPSYGEDVTYRPLAEIVDQLGGADRFADADATMTQLVLGAIGLAEAPAQAEEIFWAVRRLLEHAAEARPLVIVVEDIHWAESTLLDLLEYLLAFVGGHALLLVCLTRPDLADIRPSWVGPHARRSLLVLDPLPEPEARRLVEGAGDVDPAAAARIVETAEGNPLFLEQLVAVGAEDGATALPTSIHAVLAARIARLPAGERALLEEASIQGRSFYAGALGAPAPAQLVALVNQQLIRPERSELPGEDAFQFAHALIQEAAYRGLPKQSRAELHERAARWIDAQPGARDESVGHHLAEAYRYRGELGDADHVLAGEAAERLAAAAEAALLRGDPASGARLFERSAALLDWHPAARGEVLPALGAALFDAGRRAEATRVLDEAIAVASEPRLRARAEIERELVRVETETTAGIAQSQRVTDAALPVLDADQDDHGLCRLWLLRGRLAWHAGRAQAADDAWQRAADHARHSGARSELFEVIGWRALAAALGPTPVDAAIRHCSQLHAEAAASPIATANTLNPLALLHAMKGDGATAERLLGEAAAIERELGGRLAGVSHIEASLRLLAGQPELAEARLRAEAAALEAMGEHDTLATTTALLAEAVYAQGRFDEAGELCRLAGRRAGDEDIATQALRRGVEAKVLARAGRCADATAVAREAVDLLEPTDLLSQRGAAMLDLAEVLRICGDLEAADGAAHAGRALYERKGNEAAGGT